MKELVDKISSYNIFNYLLPGVLFVYILEICTSFYLSIPDNVIISAFFFYFIGLTISRVGSLIVGPILKKIKIINFVEYKQFIEALKNDPKIEVLSEENNMYRSLTSVFCVLLLVKLYEFIIAYIPSLYPWTFNLLIVVLLVVFILSYRKQTEFIVKRVNSQNK